jgi:RNA polymerase sigma-70 factor (ECF subfamily)
MQCESIRVLARDAGPLASPLLASDAPRGGISIGRWADGGLRWSGGQGANVSIPVTPLGEGADVELVRRCRAGEAGAFDALFSRHSGAVSRLIYRMTGATPDVEDLVQEVFLQVIRSLGSFRDEARFSTWLYRVTVNVVLMHRRAANRRPRLVDEERGLPPVDEAPSAEQALETRLRVQAFYRLLDRLSDKKRAVFVLHELEGLSPASISDIVQAPVLTVRTRLFYARRDVLRWLADEPDLSVVASELGAPTASSAPPLRAVDPERFGKEVP